MMATRHDVAFRLRLDRRLAAEELIRCQDLVLTRNQAKLPVAIQRVALNEAIKVYDKATKLAREIRD